MKKSSLKISADLKSAASNLAADYKSATAISANKPEADLTLAERVMAPTPKFFRTLRTIGVVIGLVGGAILASPLALPAAIVTVGGYLALAGSIVTGVSQTAVEKE
jgi:hypothetical protein